MKQKVFKVFEMDKQRKNIPYKVPEKYFEQLPQTITNRISEHKNSFLDISLPLSKTMKLALPSVCLLLFLMFFYKPWSNNSIEAVSLDQALAQIPHAEVEAYLLNNGISDTELFDYFEESESTDKILSELPVLNAEELEGMVDTYDIETLF